MLALQGRHRASAASRFQRQDLFSLSLTRMPSGMVIVRVDGPSVSFDRLLHISLRFRIQDKKIVVLRTSGTVVPYSYPGKLIVH